MVEVEYWVGFNIVHGIGPMKFRALLNHFGDLEDAWHADARELKEAGLDRRALKNLMTTRSTISLDAEMEKIKRQGAKVLTWDRACTWATLARSRTPIWDRGPRWATLATWAMPQLGPGPTSARGRSPATMMD